jgi:UV DNA damage endonuclease
MLGFACKFEGVDLNLKSTTLTWLRANPLKSDTKLQDLLTHNLSTLHKQILAVSKLPKSQRMFRISSDLLPAYTTDDFMPFYYSKNNQLELERKLMAIGDLARATGVRLSFHPGQFCVLASEHEGVVENSIMEFEYHADLIRWMGYGKTFQDFKCNVHIGGKGGPDKFRETYYKLSREARNCITVENQEFTWGLEHTLELSDIIPTVFDIHHDWIYTGTYRSRSSELLDRVLESWRGVKPTMHYSLSRVLEDGSENSHTKMALRAHSDYMFDGAVNDIVYEYFTNGFDVMVEAKMKNAAQQRLIDYWVEKFKFDPDA